MQTYVAMRVADRQSYLLAHGWFDLCGWFPFADQDTFDRVHVAAMSELASRNYGSSSWADSMAEEVIAAVITGLFPALSPFSGLIADAVLFVVKQLIASMEGLFKVALDAAQASGLTFSDGFKAAAVRQWQAEAQAA